MARPSLRRSPSEGDDFLSSGPQRARAEMTPPSWRSIARDLRHALRGLARARATAAVVVLSLALGTGANAVLYTAMDALLFRPPAGVMNPSRLVTIATGQFNGGVHGLSSYPDFLSIRAHLPGFQSMAAFDDGTVEDVQLGESTQRVRLVEATEEFFLTLGGTEHLGRLPSRHPTTGSGQSAVISFSLWTTFGSPVDIVGQPLRVGGRSYTVAAVAAAGFGGLRLGRTCDVWVPLRLEDRRLRGDRRLSIIARLDDRVTLEEAQQQATLVANSLASQFPETNRGTRAGPNETRPFSVRRYSRIDPSAGSQQALLSVVGFGATAMLLLCACVNTASLLLSRTAAKRQEIAVKLALGARRTWLIRQALVEGLLLACSGAALGLVLAGWMAGLLPSLLSPEGAQMLDTTLDAAAITGTIMVAVVAGALFAIGPARLVTRTLDIEALRTDAGVVSAGRARAPLRAALVTGQMAFSTALLIAAAGLLDTLSSGLEGDLGVSGGEIAIALLQMPTDRPGEVATPFAFRHKASDALRRMPSIESVAWVNTLPVRTHSSKRFAVDVRPGLIETADLDTNIVSAGYFRMMQVVIVEGRDFNETDGALAVPVVIVNDVLAKRYFGPSAVGHHLTDVDGTRRQIVGVVRSGKYRAFQEDPTPIVYFPLSQSDPVLLHVLAKTTAGAGPLLPQLRRELLRSGRASVLWTTTFDEHLAHALISDRAITTVVGACGLLALALSTIGVYGMVADMVRRRTQEIGLRVALGARTWNVVALVFREGLLLTAAGALAGSVGAVMLAGVVRSFVPAWPLPDTASVGSVALTLVVVVVAAATLPARRALRISPAIALHTE
jgi:macrolide transport system ATP-binding/permease protein